jgi:diacylglycerol kinase
MLKSFFRSFGFAWRGVCIAFAEHRNLKVQATIGVAVVTLGFYLNLTYLEWCILLCCIALVLGMEIVNSSIETIVNLVKLEFHPLAGKIKDMAAGAVLVVSFFAAMIGMVLFYHVLQRQIP